MIGQHREPIRDDHARRSAMPITWSSKGWPSLQQPAGVAYKIDRLADSQRLAVLPDRVRQLAHPPAAKTIVPTRFRRIQTFRFVDQPTVCPAHPQTALVNTSDSGRKFSSLRGEGF